jgi:hypothetical protein
LTWSAATEGKRKITEEYGIGGLDKPVSIWESIDVPEAVNIVRDADRQVSLEEKPVQSSDQSCATTDDDPVTASEPKSSSTTALAVDTAARGVYWAC